MEKTDVNWEYLKETLIKASQGGVADTSWVVSYMKDIEKRNLMMIWGTTNEAGDVVINQYDMQMPASIKRLVGNVIYIENAHKLRVGTKIKAFISIQNKRPTVIDWTVDEKLR